MAPSKAMRKASPGRAARPLSAGRKSLSAAANSSRAPWIRSSLTSAVSRSSFMPLTSTGSNSGSASSARVNSRSLPGSGGVTSTLGVRAGRTPRSVIACRHEVSIVSRNTSPRTDLPNRRRSTGRGALPGRKPLMFAVPASSSSFLSIRPSMSSAGTTMRYSRFKPSDRVSVICMEVSRSLRRGRYGAATAWCGRRDSNPQGLAATRT